MFRDERLVCKGDDRKTLLGGRSVLSELVCDRELIDFFLCMLLRCFAATAVQLLLREAFLEDELASFGRGEHCQENELCFLFLTITEAA